jgi:hypothetical protein
MGDAYWKNRQAVLMAIARAVKKHNIELAQKGIVVVPGREAGWRDFPKEFDDDINED